MLSTACLSKIWVECFDEAYYVFALGKPASKWPDGYVIIDDVNTRPDIVLIMCIENGEFIFETTDKTYLVEEKRQP